MGLMDFVKGGVRELMIARPDNMKHLIVYKHPDETVPMWSQLTVDSDEGCVFFRDGQVYGILGAGRHTLNSQNIPFLGQLIDKFTGGNVFKAEVFFVRTQPLRNDPVKFGAKLDGMTDPGTELACNPRIHGDLVVRVLDPVRFIIGLTGQAIQPHDNQQILRYVGDSFKVGVEQTIVDACNETATSVLNISTKKRELQQRFIQQPPAGFAEIGLAVVEIVQFKISLPPEQEQELREAWNIVGKAKRAAMAKQFEINQQVGERQAYVDMAQRNPGFMAEAQAHALRKAGDGMAAGGGGGAGVAGLGAQMAVGVGMAGMMQQGFYQPAMHYQHVQAPAGATVACAACGVQNTSGKFCANCGQPLAPPQPQGGFCSACGQPVSGKFCASCGTPFQAGGSAPQPGYPQAPQPGYPQAPQPGYPQAPPHGGGYSGGTPGQGGTPGGAQGG